MCSEIPDLLCVWLNEKSMVRKPNQIEAKGGKVDRFLTDVRLLLLAHMHRKRRKFSQTRQAAIHRARSMRRRWRMER
jgi:hypothetical protein